MRIVGGAHRGAALAGPGRTGGIRPTSDRVRESLFNLLAHAHGDPVPGARVLDLFAGTGALALEALSRGAASAVLVEQGGAAARLIAENVRRLDLAARARLVRADARRLPRAQAPADLVFADPPYGRGLGAAALLAAAGAGWIAPGSLVVLEEGDETEVPGLTRLDLRRYGDSWVHILRA